MAEKMKRKRPNIVIFNPDQMRADALGHLGNPAMPTSFLDEFAQNDAVSFRRAFCQNPVCGPSRCSFLTGLYPHVNGHRSMSYLLHSHETTLLKELKDAGYYVWMNPRNDFLAVQEAGILERNANEVFYGGDINPAPGNKKNVRGTPGDKHFYSFYMGELDTDQEGKNKTIDDESVEKAVELIQGYDKEEPFCIFLGLLYPHPPYQIEEPYFSAINRSLMKKRITEEETDLSTKPKMMQELKKLQGLDDFTEKDWDDIRSCYLGMCMKVDDLFKMLCDALKEKGVYDDTAIFFFSDHGDYTGDYGIAEKNQNTFEDCLVNVPFLIKAPKGYDVSTGINENMVELVDFYATAMEMCQVQPAHAHYGKSLVPLLADKTVKGRKYVHSEGGRLKDEMQCSEATEAINPYNIYYPRFTAQQDHVASTKATMIRSDQYKYVKRLYEKDEFYDLLSDPKETHNKIDDHQYAPEIAEMRAELLNWYQATCDMVPYEIDVRLNFDMSWNRIKKMCPPDREEEMKERLRNGEDMFYLMQCLVTGI